MKKSIIIISFFLKKKTKTKTENEKQYNTMF